MYKCNISGNNNGLVRELVAVSSVYLWGVILILVRYAVKLKAITCLGHVRSCYVCENHLSL